MKRRCDHCEEEVEIVLRALYDGETWFDCPRGHTNDVEGVLEPERGDGNAPPGFRIAASGVSRWFPTKLAPEQHAEAARLNVPVAIEHELTGMALVLIPGGEFVMGASPGDSEARDDEKPTHRVALAPFYAATTPVTQDQWERVVGGTRHGFKGADRPTELVTWYGTEAYFKALPGSGLRLPFEAEWERAARAGTTTKYWFGEQYVKGMANCDETEIGGTFLDETSEVGNYDVNPWGLWDVLGNVWEWCEGWYESYIDRASSMPRRQRTGQGTFRACRGGSFGDTPRRLRVSARDYEVGSERWESIGFRCVRDVIL